MKHQTSITPALWPANSLDLNPVDYQIGGSCRSMCTAARFVTSTSWSRPDRRVGTFPAGGHRWSNLTSQCRRTISLKSDVVCQSYGNVYSVIIFRGHGVCSVICNTVNNLPPQWIGSWVPVTTCPGAGLVHYIIQHCRLKASEKGPCVQ